MTGDKSLELQSCKNRGSGGVVQIYDGYLLTRSINSRIEILFVFVFYGVLNSGIIVFVYPFNIYLYLNMV